MFDDHEVHTLIYELRNAMDYGNPPFSISSLMELMFPEIDVVGRRLEHHALIEVYPEPLPDGTRAVIAYNENDHHSTQRFSIGHELAHWLLDFKRGEALPPQPFACGIKVSGRRPALERRADYFAAELLCPLWVLDRYVDFEIYPSEDDEDALSRRNQKVQRLASRFNLSMRAMRNRVTSLHGWRKIIR